MKETKASKSTAHGHVANSPELVEYIENRWASLRRVLQARAGAESALDKAIAESKTGRAMLAERKQLAQVLQKAYRSLSEGKETRLQIIAKHGKALQKFHKKYRPIAEKAWLRVAEASPSAYQIYRAFHNVEKPPEELDMKILYFLGFVFRYETPTATEDTATTSQALDVVPPLDQSAGTGSFPLHIEERHTNALGLNADTYLATPGGSFSALAGALTMHNVPGEAACRALLGASFNFPPGYTKFSISADIDWTFDLTSCVAFGGAGCGVDLLLRVEPAGGSNAVEKLQPLASAVAPVFWVANTTGSGSSSIALSLELAGSSARTLTVFGGGSSHGEAEGFNGFSIGSVYGKVQSISVHAE